MSGLLSLLSVAGPADTANAQLSGALSAVTDVRYRGLSLNGGRPALAIAVAYDDASGVYAGMTATGGATRRFGTRFLGHSEFIGYAARFGRDWSWEAGLSNTQVNSNVLRRFSGHYTEVYAALNSEQFNARMFVSPDYIVADLSTVYVELNGFLRPSRRSRVFGHAGYLRRIDGDGGFVLRNARADLRAGVAAEFRGGEVQLAATRSGAGRGYLRSRSQSRDAVTLSITRFF